MSKSVDDLMGEVVKNKPTPKHDNFIFDDSDELVAAINAKCRILADGNDILFVVRDDKNIPRLLRRRDAETLFAQYQLSHEVTDTKGRTTTKILPGFNVWLKSESRTPKWERKVFNPNVEEVGPNDFNTWTGFAVTAKEGDWSLLRTHIRENICRGNEEHFQYLLGWMAQMIQEPGIKIGVAVAFRGPKGAGKSKLPDWLRYIVGFRNAMVANNKGQWTGRFTSQLKEIILLTCEEAFFAGGYEEDAAMKHTITSIDYSYEAKGKEIENGKNFTRVIIITNERWVVPATQGERRYFVQDVGTEKTKDTAYFAAIDAQMKAGGAAAMLYDLMKHNFSAIDLRNPPETDALRDQIEVGLKADVAWLHSVLSEGEFPFRDPNRKAVSWPDKPDEGELTEHDEAKRRIVKADICASYLDFVPGYRDRPATQTIVGKFLKNHVPKIEGVRNRVFGELTPHYRLPWLSEARAAFLKANPGLRFGEPDIDETKDDAMARSAVVPFPTRQGRF